MRTKRLDDLVDALPGARLVGDGSVTITGISYDSRNLFPGALFVALRGGDFDGHCFVDAAVAGGASAVLIEEDVSTDVPRIIAPESSRAALAMVSCAFYDDPSRELRVVGITGTDGKTTTAAMLENILTGTGHRTGAMGTVGIRIGNGATHDLGHQTTPESSHVQRYLREMADAGSEFAVLEATSHGLATHRLDGVRFVAGGVTNITREHLEFHKTIENYRRAKAILLERVAVDEGVVVLNNDDAGAMAVRPWADGAEVTTYSASGDETALRAIDIDHTGTGVSFDVVAGEDMAAVELPMPGAFNVANALCAIGLAMGCGVPLRETARALSSAEPVTGRMQPIETGQPFRVIVDYAHTPESLKTILTLLRTQYPGGRLIVVTGSAGERDVEKRPLQGAVCARLADITIVTNEDPRHEDPDAIIAQIVAGAGQAGAVQGATVFGITDRREAIAHAFAVAQPDDCVLLAGKGHERSIIQGFEHHPWNEAAIAEELLREMTGM